jgi:hypothetical protein
VGGCPVSVGGLKTSVRRSRVYLVWVILIEAVVSVVSRVPCQMVSDDVARLLLGPNGVWLVAQR